MKTRVGEIDRLMAMLPRSPAGAVFNPWRDVDRENDLGRNAPRIRRDQLRAYLSERLATARLVLVGEALSYRGGHFTGIAMMSERILLGHDAGIDPTDVIGGLAPRRTSRMEKSVQGFAEPTATIVWRALGELAVPPRDFVAWNAFPWHSYEPRAGVLSNRRPTRDELAAGRPVLDALLRLFACERVVALGRIAALQLVHVSRDADCVRHPASGGARQFRRQMAAVVKAL
jgi:hypothetical protein